MSGMGLGRVKPLGDRGQKGRTYLIQAVRFKRPDYCIDGSRMTAHRLTPRGFHAGKGAGINLRQSRKLAGFETGERPRRAKDIP